MRDVFFPVNKECEFINFALNFRLKFGLESLLTTRNVVFVPQCARCVFEFLSFLVDLNKIIAPIGLNWMLV